MLGVDEYLEIQEGKIRKCLFFYGKVFSNNSVLPISEVLIVDTEESEIYTTVHTRLIMARQLHAKSLILKGPRHP